jgi:hypothetical protein
MKKEVSEFLDRIKYRIDNNQFRIDNHCKLIIIDVMGNNLYINQSIISYAMGYKEFFKIGDVAYTYSNFWGKEKTRIIQGYVTIFNEEEINFIYNTVLKLIKNKEIDEYDIKERMLRKLKLTEDEFNLLIKEFKK